MSPFTSVYFKPATIINRLLACLWLQESYVWKMYQERLWDFFPAGDCFRKQYEDQLGWGRRPPLSTLRSFHTVAAATNSNNRITFFYPRDKLLLWSISDVPLWVKGGRGDDPQLAWTFSFFSFRDSFFDSVLPFTPHNPESLHNFLGRREVLFWETPGCVGLWDVCVSYYAPEPEFSYFENVELET